MSWLPPFCFACTGHALEAKEGGKHRMSFRNFTTSNSHAFGGTYLKLGPGATLDYTDTFDDPNLSGEMKVTVSLIDPIVALAGPEVYGSSIAASRRDKFIDDMPGTILRCAAAWRPGAVPGPMSEPVRSAKVGRNDPCPCGSGKKYKKGCGGGGATSSMH